MTWREQLSNGYPWKPLAFVVVAMAFAIVVAISMMVSLPAERAVIDHGMRVTGHAVAYRATTRKDRFIAYEANLTWHDADGHAHEQRGLGISDNAYRAIGDGKDVELRTLGDLAVIETDVEHRVRDESNAPVILVIIAIAMLLGIYHWRRRLREWRTPKPVRW